MKKDPVQDALAALDDATPAQLEKALSSKWNLVIAKAVRSVQSTSPLAATFRRLLENGPVLDKGCTALTAIARALVTLECDDADLFRAGIRHVQMEAVWNGREDTAAQLRSTCAVGLANTHDRHRLRDLAELLADPEWVAREGAAHALAAVGSEAAATLLRYKAIVGDKSPDVMAECFAGLIEIESAEALPLIRRLASVNAPEISEPALLALGASRRPDAIDILKDAYETTADFDRRKCILLALSSSRDDGALAFLVNIVRTGTPSNARLARDAMSIHRKDPRIAAMLEG